MFQVRDRVCLKKDAGGFGAGCEGEVVVVVGDDIVVHIDKDEEGNDVTPFPLPPLAADEYFRPC